MPEDHLEPIPFEAPTLEELDILMDGYKFESFIAQGGMGAVYLARQTSLDRQVAIKVLPRELGDDAKFREGFQAEAKHMAKLNHPNLIGIYDFGDIDGMLFIIMEFVKGKSLHSSAHGKAIVQETAAGIIRDICMGLNDAHEAGILHRDIKPANILIGKKATPKIGDFGLARPTGNTETGVIYGTPGYAAPEVLNSPDDVDVRTDVFAVGVMFYELLTGSMPEVEYEPVYELADVDERFDKIVRKAIHPKPSGRFGSAEEMADAISEVLKELKAESEKPVNPLLTGANKKSGNPKLVAPVVENSAAVKLSAPVSSGAVTGPVSTPLAPASAAAGPSESNSTRNILIILILLGAVYGALQFKSSREKDVAKMEADAKAENDKKQALKAKLEAEKAEERRIAAQKRREEEERKNKMNSGNDPSVTDVPKNADIVIGPGSPEYPMKQLENSRVELASGTRAKNVFPDSAVFRDNGARAVMFINKPMTWDEADEWAGEYGAHLAVCSNQSDLVQFSKMMTEKGGAWLGGGNNGNKGWVWVDGTQWQDFASLPTTKKRAFVTVNNFGNINAESKLGKKLPFFIEWKMVKSSNGAFNPGSLEERLARTSGEVGGRSINPKFPAGSINLGPRTYCPVYREMTYKRAQQLAEKAGGHLLVVSNKNEIIYLEEFISRLLEKNTACWIGGSKSSDLWRWSTGESWVKLPWKRGHPKKGTKLQLVTGQKIVLKDADSGDKAPMFIIEWSEDKDKVSKNTGSNANSDSGKGLKKLNNWHEAKLQKEIIAAEKLFSANVRKLTFDLEFYLKGLPRNVREAEEDAVKRIHAKAKNNDRLPENIDGVGPSQKVREITSYGIKKQKKIKTELDIDIEKLRQLYIKHMMKYRADMEEKGQQSIIDTIDESIRSAGKDADDYREHFNN